MTEAALRRPVGRLLVAIVVTLAAGLGVRAVFAGAVAKYGGVALWAALVYLLVVLVRRSMPWRHAAAVALAISWGVEFLQLTPLPAWLSSQHIVLRLVFGTTFNPPDLPAYAAGVVLATLLDRRLLSAARGDPAQTPN